jgi:hypothetical protein
VSRSVSIKMQEVYRDEKYENADCF